MEPAYRDGDILIVERADSIEIGEIGIFTLDGEGYVKQIWGWAINLSKRKLRPYTHERIYYFKR